MALMRLDKFISVAGIGTRSEVKKLIGRGLIRVNGTVVKDAAFKVDPEKDTVTMSEGSAVDYSEFEYYMLNKPAGIVSASRKNSLKRGESIPEGGERYAVDLIKESRKTDLFPAGRLDKDTEGLLLITNDGALSHKLLSPKNHVDKTYYVELSDELTDDNARLLEKGVDIGDEKPTLPCTVNVLFATSCFITISEGRYHQIKRMFASLGLKVTYLKRVTFGPLALPAELMPGEYRPLTQDEILSLIEI